MLMSGVGVGFRMDLSVHALCCRHGPSRQSDANGGYVIPRSMGDRPPCARRADAGVRVQQRLDGRVVGIHIVAGVEWVIRIGRLTYASRMRAFRGLLCVVHDSTIGQSRGGRVCGAVRGCIRCVDDVGRRRRERFRVA
eukprot:1081580-Pleurochrysis_carterae.AAC.1